jgi:predicted enzyme related to lactoylglutathione lyase
MTLHIVQWTLDVNDLDLEATFWSHALGYRIEPHGDDGAKLYPPDDAPPGSMPVWLQHTAGRKRDKIRGHPDLMSSDDVDTEVARLLDLGATRADIGQTDDNDLVVLADPEGNEFCVLRRSP